MPIYDVAPGALLETADDRLLDEEELEKARELYARGASIEDVARKTKGARVWEPREEPVGAGVVVDLEALTAALGEEKVAELLGADPARARN